MNINMDTMINSNIINKYINNENLKEKADIEIFESISSTNTVLKEYAKNGADEWKILIADEQTEGRGRLNRKFFSPSKTGIYMSILLRPDIPVNEALFITTMTAVAVAEAIDTVTNTETKIKWVNDIFYNDKKICGILTEASISSDGKKLDYAVVGIGINVMPPNNGFPKDLEDTATSILNTPETYNLNIIKDFRCKIIAFVLNNIDKYYKNISEHKFMSVYKEKSLLIGKYVYITDDTKKEKLLVKDIDDTAALIVQKSDGTIFNLSSGEVSVKLL